MYAVVESLNVNCMKGEKTFEGASFVMFFFIQIFLHKRYGFIVKVKLEIKKK